MKSFKSSFIFFILCSPIFASDQPVAEENLRKKADSLWANDETAGLVSLFTEIQKTQPHLIRPLFFSKTTKLEEDGEEFYPTEIFKYRYSDESALELQKKWLALLMKNHQRYLPKSEIKSWKLGIASSVLFDLDPDLEDPLIQFVFEDLGLVDISEAVCFEHPVFEIPFSDLWELEELEEALNSTLVNCDTI